ncbi:MAG: DUF255 domain-containing protein [Candidatus Micrarchaeota archaeon]
MAYPEGSAVHWRQYSQGAFEDAKQQLKPVFMLISARWCHWCHLYENETIESAEVSKVLNGHFIPIIIDADKRQDLAAKYLAGGWPTSIIFDFKGGKLASFSGHINKNALIGVLQQAAEGKIGPEARMPETDETKRAQYGTEIAQQFISEYNARLAYVYDDIYGGFGAGRKFHNSNAADYLVTKYAQEKKALWKGMAERSLEAMKQLQDRVDGGFFRYAATREWSDPHYEKMLDVNSAISGAYLKAGKAFGNESFVKIAEGNLEWMLKTLYDAKNGGFYGSQEADGHFYNAPPEERKKLMPPAVDKTKYCGWNAEAAIAFLHGHKMLAKLEYFGVADRTLEFMKKKLVGKNGALHYYNEAEGGKLDGSLADNAWAAVAFFEAHKIGREEEHFETGKLLLDYCISELYSEQKGAFIERNSRSTEMYLANELKSERILYRENAIACWMLLLGHGATKDRKYMEMAKKVIANFLYCEDDIDSAALIAQVASNLLKT